MVCPVCRKESPPGAASCVHCGIRHGVICPACRQELPLSAKFCFECGQPLGSKAFIPPRFASPEMYTPKHLAEKILASRSTLEGERKLVTVLFADIQGSLELFEGKDPEEARALLDPALHTMMGAIHQYEGTVNQVLGDGIMALFGAPLAHEDHALRASYAALKMQEAIRAYADHLLRRFGVGLRIRVGLNAGEVVVRGIGNDLAMDYTAVGQTTHLAARMEQLAAPGTILASGRVAHLAGDFLHLKPLGPMAIKGMADPVQVFEVIGAARSRTPKEAAASRGLTPFVGRRAELDILSRALEQTRAGHGQVVALVGEPGVGKTRLGWEFLKSPSIQGVLVLECTSLSYGRTIAYQAVLDLLKTYFMLGEQDDGGTIREKIGRKLLGMNETLMDALPTFLVLLGLLVEDPEWRGLDTYQRGQRILDDLKRLLLAESRQQPLLLVFENMHWIDADTQAFLDTLNENVPAYRICLLLTYRPEYKHPWKGKSHFTELRIEPLSPPSAKEFAQLTLGDEAASGPLREFLLERTGGNPLFLEESIKTLVETGVLAGEQGAYRLARPIKDIGVPATVQAVLAARIDRLPPEEKRLLQSAAVIGRQVPVALLQVIADLPEATLRTSLAYLQTAEFLYESSLFPDAEYTFKHNLTHEVAYASLLHERRRALHARIVEAIEALPPDVMSAQIERLAHHAFRSEAWAKAVRYQRQAGTKALRGSANEEAVACYERALAALQYFPDNPERLEQDIDLRLELLAPLLQLGRLPDVLSLSQEAESMCRRLDDMQRLARVMTFQINYHYLKGQPDLSVGIGEQCLRMTEAGGDPALGAQARRYMGHCYHAQGRFRQADLILRQNLEVLEASGDIDRTGRDSLAYVASCGWLAFVMTELGEFDRAQVYADKACQAAQASKHAYTAVIAQTLEALVWLRRGQPSRAMHPLEQSLRACTEHYLALWQPVASSWLGLTHVLLGQTKEAIPFLQEGVTRTEALGIKAYLSLWVTHLAEGLLASGQTDHARVTAEHALDLALTHKEGGHQARALCLLGDIASQDGSLESGQAEGYYRHGLMLADNLGMRPVLALCHLGLGKLYRSRGQRLGAEEHLGAAFSLFAEMDMRLWLVRSASELKKLGNLFIVETHQATIYNCLRQQFREGDVVQVILDRRRAPQRDDLEIRKAQWLGPERRRRSVQQKPHSYGFLVTSKEFADSRGE